MTIRLYLDEDSMSHALVAALQSRGVDVVTALDVNLTGRPDEEHLQYASSEERVLYSFNVQDFFRIHAETLNQGASHTGIILCQQQRFSIGEQMRRVLKLMSELSTEEMIDRVEFLSNWN